MYCYKAFQFYLLNLCHYSNSENVKVNYHTAQKITNDKGDQIAKGLAVALEKKQELPSKRQKSTSTNIRKQKHTYKDHSLQKHLLNSLIET